jgi:hypothetical protein
MDSFVQVCFMDVGGYNNSHKTPSIANKYDESKISFVDIKAFT